MLQVKHHWLVGWPVYVSIVRRGSSVTPCIHYIIIVARIQQQQQQQQQNLCLNQSSWHCIAARPPRALAVCAKSYLMRCWSVGYSNVSTRTLTSLLWCSTINEVSHTRKSAGGFSRPTEVTTVWLIFRVNLCNLARPACLPGGLYILLMCFLYFFHIFNGPPRRKIDLKNYTKRIFTKISGLVELCKALINPASFWQSFKGRCLGNQLKSQNRSFSRNFFGRADILKRIGILECQWAA